MERGGKSDLTAREIIEGLLHKTAEAMLQRDFEALNACFQVPFVVETEHSKLAVETVEAHRALFERIVEGYAVRGVTDIVRVCEAAEFVSDTVIRSLHISHVMAGDQRVEEPMPTLATVEWINDGWRITGAQYVTAESFPVGRAISLQARTQDGTGPEAGG